MNSDQFIQCFRYILTNSGIPPSSTFARWSLLAYPFWSDTAKQQVGFKVMAYRGVNSRYERVMKSILAHGLNCFVSGLATGATGLGSVAGGLNDISGKFGKLTKTPKFDVGAVQLATALEDPNASEQTIANAILASGKLLMYVIARVDKVPGGYRIRLRICRDFRGGVSMQDADWSSARIAQFHEMGDIREFTAWANGIVFDGRRPIGNYLR